MRTSTVVGYNNAGMVYGGQLLSGAFVSIGDSGKTLLSQIRPEGYQNNQAFIDEGTDGQFNFFLLTNAGETLDENYYSWLDYIGEDGEWGGDGIAGWYNIDGQLVGVDCDDVELTPGDALWFNCPEPPEKLTYKFSSSGQVATRDIAYPLVYGGNSVGNMMAVTLKLSTITPDGYQANPTFIDEGTDGQFNFFILTNAGETLDENYYSWLDYIGEDGEWGGDGIAGWYNIDGQLVGVDCDDVDITPSMGLWFNCPEPPEVEGKVLEYTLNFKAPKLD